MRNDRRKPRAAALSIASTSLPIALKVVAGLATGSVAILTEGSAPRCSRSELAHELQSEIRGRLGGGADVLIHLEPGSALRQVDGGGEAYGEHHAEVAGVAVQEQQDRGHQADHDRG